MSTPAHQPTAQVIDFTEYRRRRAAAAKPAQAQAKRQFLWGWPAAGQLAVVEFSAAQSQPSARARWNLF